MEHLLVCSPAEFMAASKMERRKLVLAQIDATPEHWDQTDWATETACGTAYCAAGWAATLAGYEVNHDGDVTMSTGRRWVMGIVFVANDLLGLGYEGHGAYAAGLTREELGATLTTAAVT